MYDKAKIDQIVSFVLLGAFLLFLLTNCSLLWKTENKHTAFTNKELALFASGVRPHKGDPESLYKLGCYLQERKKHNLALGEFQKAVLIDPTYVKAYNAMGISYDLMGDYRNAIESYGKALKVEPDLDYVQNNLGYSYMLQGNYDAAIAAFEKAVALNGRNKRYNNNLGLAYAKKGKVDMALAAFKRSGDEAKAHYNIGEHLYSKGSYEEAKDHFAKASTMNPSSNQAKKSLKAAANLADIFHTEEMKRPRYVIAVPSVKMTVPKKRDKPRVSHEPVFAQTKKRDEIKKVGTPVVRETRRGNELKGIETLVVHKKQGSSEKIDGKTRFTIQVAAYKSMRYVEKMKRKLKNRGYSVHYKMGGKNKTMYLVRAGTFDTRADAEAEAAKLSGNMTVVASLSTKEPQPEKARTPQTEPANISEPKMARSAELEKPRDLHYSAEIEIANGNGVSRMARRVGKFLKDKGFNVDSFCNADHFGYTTTEIYYRRGHLQDAYRIAQQMPGFQDMEEVPQFDKPNIKVRVLLGKNLIPYNHMFQQTAWGG